MRSSHKAFLPRKALGNAWNRFPVPIVFLFCWFCFFNFPAAHGHSDRGRSKDLDNNTCWYQAEPDLIKVFLQDIECPSVQWCSCSAYCSLGTEQADIKDSDIVKQSEQQSQSKDATDTKKVEGDSVSLGGESVKDTPKTDRLLRDAPLGLDEFKSKTINAKGKPPIHEAGSIMHRVEPDGTEYNFASATKGAKVLAVNKEAKGASHILGKDVDKYLRNPCSAEEKFVVIELSEETLVDTVEIANLEHYSSNLRHFQLLGSLIYPTDSWFELGNFTARNVKQSQRFNLPEPKWVRYLKLFLVSHYGSGFYCTLSSVKVYGVDAVERMLEDLISDQDNIFTSEELTEEPLHAIHSSQDGPDQKLFKEDDTPSASDETTQKDDPSTIDQVGDSRQPQPVARMPGDSVLKILMQKVRSLDLDLSVTERYLEEMNARYGNIFKDMGKGIAEKDALLKDTRSDLRNLGDQIGIIGKDVEAIKSWKSIVSFHLDILEKENAFLRLKMEKILENETHMENKGIVVFLISFLCCMIAFIKLAVDMIADVCRRKQDLGRFVRSKLPMIYVLSICSTIGIILLL